MNSFKRVVFNERAFLAALLGMFVLRLTYALTRDVFNSGPDAPVYAVAPHDFAKYGFFSSHITGRDFYPLGAPATLWPAAQFGGSHWVTYATIMQIIFSIATVWFVYKTVGLFFNKEMALSVGYVFLFMPAFIPMSGEAMYEPILMFFFYLYLYLILKSKRDSANFNLVIWAGIVGGWACAVHPRTIPWILAIQAICFVRLGRKHSLIFLGAFMAPVALFLIRNLIAHHNLTLSAAANGFVKLREGHYGTLLSDGFWYAIHYWSPYSGDARRATWLHNFTLYHKIKAVTHSSTSITVIATVFALISLVAWLYGSVLLIRSGNLVGNIVLVVPMINWITDFFTIGDSRHRLVVVPLMLISQLYVFRMLYEKMRPGERSWIA